MSTTASLGNLATIDHGARRASVREGKSRVSLGLVLSLLLHLALVVLLVTRPPAKGVPKPQKQRLVTISLETLRESGKPSAQAVEMPAPKEQPKLLHVPVPPQAQAAPKKPAPPQPQRAATAPHPPQATPTPPQPSTAAPAQKHGEEGESLGLTMLGRVRENWLRPAHSTASFHCRLRIDYLAGGAIRNVTVMEGCGDGVLDDSVERAIWKTQPLPLGPAQQGPGSLVLDFTP